MKNVFEFISNNILIFDGYIYTHQYTHNDSQVYKCKKCNVKLLVKLKNTIVTEQNHHTHSKDIGKCKVLKILKDIKNKKYQEIHTFINVCISLLDQFPVQEIISRMKRLRDNKQSLDYISKKNLSVPPHKQKNRIIEMFNFCNVKLLIERGYIYKRKKRTSIGNNIIEVYNCEDCDVKIKVMIYNKNDIYMRYNIKHTHPNNQQKCKFIKLLTNSAIHTHENFLASCISLLDNLPISDIMKKMKAK